VTGAAHTLEATPATTANCFSRGHSPVLEVSPGDSVLVSSLDAGGHLAPLTDPASPPPTMFTGRRGHCLTGPVAVRGAQPGDTLAVTLESIRPGSWGWTAAAAHDTPVTRRLGLDGGPPAWLTWEIDAEAGTAVTAPGDGPKLRRAIAPFLGVTGVAPAEPGEHSTIPPRPGSGGNIDCKELTAGSTLFLPVAVPGALVYLGDGHAAQGDGEAGGTAIECPMTTRVRLELVTGAPRASVHAVTPAGRITFGFSADLNEAMGDALDAMVCWLAGLFGLGKAAALALASTCADLRITQVANQTWGVHAVLPDGAVVPS
jgi:acetamidase/formamidase